MKRFFTFGVLLLCLAATQTAHAAEDRNAKIKAEMVQNYLLWEIAYKNKDAERIISFESPDFTNILNGETRSKEHWDAGWRYTMKKSEKIYDAKVEVKKLTIESHRVVVLSNHYFDAAMRGFNDQLSRVTATAQSRDIWVEYNGVWMLKRTEYLHTKRMINAKTKI